MRERLGFAARVLALLLLAALGAACRSEKSYRAERLDVDIVVEENGAATVTETVTFSFRGAPFTYAFRRLPAERTEGIRDVAVSEGGEAYTSGRAPGQYQAQAKGDELLVTWYFSPTQNAARTFTLTYRVEGLIRQEGGQDALRWVAVPQRHDYGITQAQVIVHLPERAAPVTGAQVLDGHAQLGLLGRRVSFLANEVEPHQPLVIGIWFPHGGLSGVPPAWQQRELAQAARSPLWIGIAGVILVAGLAGAVWAWRRHGRVRVTRPTGPVQAPPAELAPGLAGALAHNGASLLDGVATLFDLSRRGVVTVEQSEAAGRLGRSRSFAFRLLGLPPELRLFEEFTLEAAFGRVLRPAPRPARKPRGAAPQPDRAGLALLVASGQPVSLRHVAGGLRGRWRRVARYYDGELYQSGLFGPARDRLRRHLIAAGIGTLILGPLPVAVAVAWNELYGGWPLLATASLVVVGATVLAVGASASRRTPEGEQGAAAWLAFRRYLAQVARGQPLPGQADLLESYVPYALAFGLGERWAKKMKAVGAAAPAWFRALGQEVEAAEHAAAFIALIAATSAATSSSGAAAGGAAGGGASGAG